MRTELINVKATDNTVHQGMLFEPEKQASSIIIHIHGMAGNFYENTFIPVMAKNYTEQGVAFLTCNNRGHDYICDCKKIDGNTTASYKAGAAYELIEDSLFDIKGAIAFALERGYHDIILQGHSSGANKTVYSMAQSELGVRKVILLSPCDDIGIHLDDCGEGQRDANIKLARSYVEAGTPDKMMPDGTFFDYLLSAKTYLDCFQDGSALDTFPYRTPNASFDALRKVEGSVLVTFGDTNEYLLQDPTDIKALLQSKLNSSAMLTFRVLTGASHSYQGKESNLTTTVIEWLKSL
ncbi:DUF1749 domain-containing protein [Candidatus Saccharibacteria bacterium]|nr:DUF1749 domain-containing protein [Candidatus Saccharibacteria bacterium]